MTGPRTLWCALAGSALACGVATACGTSGSSSPSNAELGGPDGSAGASSEGAASGVGGNSAAGSGAGNGTGGSGASAPSATSGASNSSSGASASGAPSDPGDGGAATVPPPQAMGDTCLKAATDDYTGGDKGTGPYKVGTVSNVDLSKYLNGEGHRASWPTGTAATTSPPRPLPATSRGTRAAFR